MPQKSSSAPPTTGPTGSQGKPIPGIPADDTLTPFEKVQAFIKNIDSSDFEGFGSELLRSNLTLQSATLKPTPSGPTSICIFTLLVTPSLCNRMGNLHGGATALLIDITTTLALAPIAKPGFWQYAGVTRTLSVTYLRPAPMGKRIRIIAEVVQAGRTACTLKGTVEDEETGRLLSVAEHGKIAIEPPAAKL